MRGYTEKLNGKPRFQRKCRRSESAANQLSLLLWPQARACSLFTSVSRISHGFPTRPKCRTRHRSRQKKKHRAPAASVWNKRRTTSPDLSKRAYETSICPYAGFARTGDRCLTRTRRRNLCRDRRVFGGPLQNDQAGAIKTSHEITKNKTRPVPLLLRRRHLSRSSRRVLIFYGLSENCPAAQSIIITSFRVGDVASWTDVLITKVGGTCTNVRDMTLLDSRGTKGVAEGNAYDSVVSFLLLFVQRTELTTNRVHVYIYILR